MNMLVKYFKPNKNTSVAEINFGLLPRPNYRISKRLSNYNQSFELII